MHEKKGPTVTDGKTRPAPTVRGAQGGPRLAEVGPELHPKETTLPDLEPGQSVIGGAKEQIAQRRRLRATRSSNPIVIVTAAILVGAVAFGIYLFIVA